MKHNWCKRNPVEDVDIPSDKDAVRMNVLSPAQEMLYFVTCESLRIEKAAKNRTKEARGLQNLADLHRLMRLQGCRPEELRELEKSKVDLERGRFYVSGKCEAAKRWLKMRAESREILARRMQSPGKWIFPSSNPADHIGQHQRLHAAVLKRSGLACVPYDFRHTFATHAANEEGVPLPILASIMGHANLRSIMKYVHVQQPDMDREMIRLDSSLPAVCPLPEAKNGEETGKAGNLRDEAKTNGIM
jgi:integrase